MQTIRRTPRGLERLQNVENRRAFHHHLDAGSVKADRARQGVVFLKQEQVLSQQGVLQSRIGGAHAVVDDLNEHRFVVFVVGQVNTIGVIELSVVK